MSVRIVDHSTALKQRLFTHLAANLGDGAALLRAEVQAAIGVQGPPRSSPGSPPHRDSGALQASYTDQLDASALEARVGSDSPYVLTLELGGGNVAARPHLLATTISQANAVARVICRPM